MKTVDPADSMPPPCERCEQTSELAAHTGRKQKCACGCTHEKLGMKKQQP